MDIIIIVLLIASIVLSTVQLILLFSTKKEKEIYLQKRDKEDLISAFSSNVTIISSALQT